MIFIIYSVFVKLTINNVSLRNTSVSFFEKYVIDINNVIELKIIKHFCLILEINLIKSINNLRKMPPEVL